MFKNRKGLSLVEIVSALGVLSLIVGFILAGATNASARMVELRQKAEELFELVYDMETTIRDVNIQIDGMLFTGFDQTLTVFDGTPRQRDIELVGPASGVGFSLFSSSSHAVLQTMVRVYEIDVDLGTGDTLLTFKGPTALRYPSPEATTRDMIIRGGTHSIFANAMPSYNFITYYNSTFWLDHPWDSAIHLTPSRPGAIDDGVIFRWYTAREGFLQAHFDSDYILGEEFDFGAMLRPSLHNADFSLILPTPPSSFILERSATLDFSDFIGRQIMVSAHPHSNVGKFGQEVPSSSVYILGLPVVNSSLFAHFVAGVIERNADPANPNVHRFADTRAQVENPPGVWGSNPDEGRVFAWNNLRWRPNEFVGILPSGSTIQEGEHLVGAARATIGREPMLGFATVNVSGTAESAQFNTIDFTVDPMASISDVLTIEPFNNAVNTSEITVFVVAQQVKTAIGIPAGVTEVLMQNNWQLGFHEFSITNPIGFTTYADASPIYPTYDSSNNDHRGHFYVLSGRFAIGAGPSGENLIKHGINDRIQENIAFGPEPIFNHNSMTITIGDGFNGSIAEIIIYNGALSDGEFNDVLNYLMQKYRIDT